LNFWRICSQNNKAVVKAGAEEGYSSRDVASGSEIIITMLPLHEIEYI